MILKYCLQARNQRGSLGADEPTVFKYHSLSCPLLYCVAVSSVLKGIIRDSEGRNISATRGFLVSFLKLHFVDGIAADAVSLLQTSNGNLLCNLPEGFPLCCGELAAKYIVSARARAVRSVTRTLLYSDCTSLGTRPIYLVSYPDGLRII